MPKVRLTDVYDPANYVEIETGYNVDWWYGHYIVYYVVRLSGTTKTIESIQSFYSHSGLTMSGYKSASMNVFWLNDIQAFAVPYWEDIPVQSGKWKIHDIDPTWKGFTTGEVYVDITFDQAVVISEIGGMNLSVEGLEKTATRPLLW